MQRRAFGLLAAAVIGAGALLPAAGHADDLAAITKAGELKIAMSGQYPPFNFVNDANEVVGFDADIGHFLAGEMAKKGVDLRFGRHPVALTRDGAALSLRLDDGSALAADTGTLIEIPLSQDIISTRTTLAAITEAAQKAQQG